ncbi:HTH-type transcriptional regulator / antitoxin HigA [Allochromatium warmingii]|uniref:HTH-type transcriptional regulator / antitoxin HigA n=1 Tax=Allochromatium warmingii TaxID=61595 RepID=A0A1H3HZQ4_ALLWA|nr:transcriptional regulator [Allochromatium warmingii]SDY20685.1 HTH-type transcriptional regulator / antitoxin HigA [Allochromatium warmingii]
MSALIKQAAEHWCYVAPLLRKPTNEDEYDELVEALDELLVLIEDNESHPLASLASHMGDLIEAYDEARRPMPKSNGLDVLRYLMQERGLSEADLSDVGSPDLISDILSGRCELDIHYIRALSDHFKVPPDVFF